MVAVAVAAAGIKAVAAEGLRRAAAALALGGGVEAD
jgi:hypothetical protein